MRISKLERLSFVVLALLAMGAVLVILTRGPESDYKLADGTVLRLEKVGYGKSEAFTIPLGRLDQVKVKVAPYLPKSWAAKLVKPTLSGGRSSWAGAAVVHTNLDVLHFWLTRRDASGTNLNVSYQAAQLLDAHGCIFGATQAGGSEDGRLIGLAASPMAGSMQSSVNWLRFEGFPRNERVLKLSVFDDKRKVAAEFKADNPGMGKRALSLTPEALPIVRKAGDAQFMLQSLKVKTNFTRYGNLSEIEPTFAVVRDGKPDTNWMVSDQELGDAWGNLVWRLTLQSNLPALCFREPAWKISSRFYGTGPAFAASNISWTIRDVKVPGPGEFTVLGDEREVSGRLLTAVALAGAGEVIYSNNVPVSSVATNTAGRINTVTRGPSAGRRLGGLTGRLAANNMQTVYTSQPHVAFVGPNMGPCKRLSVMATDEQGRNYYAREMRQGDVQLRRPEEASRLQFLNESSDMRFTTNANRSAKYLLLDLPGDVKTIQLTFCIHNGHSVEFTFKPPQK